MNVQLPNLQNWCDAVTSHMKIQGILKGQEVFQNSIVQEKAAKLIFFLPYILQSIHFPALTSTPDKFILLTRWLTEQALLYSAGNKSRRVSLE